ncbi:hypothetical protein PAECIP111802_07297 [Paenibacillus allorhizosphaerae]|uniref:Uncharacterized protein n=1 Tax=Paenibacillus allorhizosphaerae TaxID=2849866 RepID=A0ABM8VUR1_9BACL|nr:hypothetical protein PAECIP111802_07297 [Paenibacillus allorhizosphaerae]
MYVTRYEEIHQFPAQEPLGDTYTVLVNRYLC